MSAEDVIVRVLPVKAPVAPTVVDVSAGATSAAQDLGAATQSRQVMIAVSAAFDIAFSNASGLSSPADKACFPAGLYKFDCTAASRYFKVTLHSNGSFTWW